MRTVTKLTLLIVLGLCVVYGSFGVLAHHRERSMFKANFERDAYRLSVALQALLTSAYEEEGLEAVRKRVKMLSERTQHTSMSVSQSPADLEDVKYDWCQVDGLSALALTIPLSASKRPPLALTITKNLELEERFVTGSSLRLLLTTMLCVVICAIITFVVGYQTVGKPIEALVEKTHRIAAGDLSRPLAMDKSDELSKLGDAMDLMCVKLEEIQRRLRDEAQLRIEALEQLRHADRLASVGKLGAGIAHELGTPLNVVQGRAKRIATGRLDGDLDAIHNNATIVVEQAERMAGIIRQLLDFARARSLNVKDSDLVTQVSRVVTLLRPTAKKAGVKIETDLPEQELRLALDREQLEQVILNLIVNAIQASETGQVVKVRVVPVTQDSELGLAAAVVVEDSGSGMTPEVLSRIFEPFFTTKGVGEGTGLGLPVSFGIVKEHGGRIHVDSRPGEGSQFTVFLPVSAGTGANPDR